MRRWTLRIVLFLVLGCVTTVAVAWGLALRVDVYRGQDDTNDWAIFNDTTIFAANPGRWVVSMARESGAARARVDRLIEDGRLCAVTQTVVMPRWAHWAGHAPAELPKRSTAAYWFYCRVVDARGWPMLAIASQVEVMRAEQGTGGWQEHVRSHGSIATNDVQPAGFSTPDLRLLPLRPIWPGFVINTLLYGVIWFGIFFGFGSARRAVRKRFLMRGGRCPKCAYDLRGTRLPSLSGRGVGGEGCSECGWNRPEDEA